LNRGQWQQAVARTRLDNNENPLFNPPTPPNTNKKQYNLVHISAGDLLREQVALGTPAGKRAKDFMDRGVLVPDDVVVDMIKDRLAQPDVAERGWLLDGYPRSASQAEAIEREGIRPDLFLLIEVPSELLVERVVGRRLDPQTGAIYHLKYNPPPADAVGRLVQRSDDTEEKVGGLFGGRGGVVLVGGFAGEGFL
jgi:adenylate kinase